MRLVLQCAVCGTVQPVGAAACGTCHAAGIPNLRLVFECLHCFRLGLAPSCEACSRPPSPAPGPLPDLDKLAERWGVTPAEPPPEDEDILAEEIVEFDLDDEDLTDEVGLELDDGETRSDEWVLPLEERSDSKAEGT